MKKFSLLKLISLICICAMLVAAVAITAFAADSEATVEIAKKNIVFGETLKLKFAINAPADVKVSAVSEGKEIGIKYVGNQTIEGVEYRVYETVSGWSAQNINTVVTVTATSGDKIDVLDYSVLMYLYERLHLDNLDPVKEATRIAMYEAFLTYAQLADKVINSEENGRTPNGLDEYYYVNVVGGTLDGYNTWGMFKKGEAPFANVESNLVVEEGQAIEWAYSVNGEDKGKTSLDNIKALTVNGEITVTATPTCKHMFAYVSADGAIQYKCSKCGEVETSFTVSADGVNTFTAPHPTSFGSNVWNAGNANALNSNGAKGKFGNVNYDEINGVQYTRVNFFAGGQMELLNNSAAPSSDYSSLSQTVYGSGQYMVIKLRMGSGESKLRFGIFDTTDAHKTIKEPGARFSIIRESFADGWAVYVIDLSKCDLTFWGQPSYACGDSSITQAFYGLRGDDDDGDGNDYVDIAYFAVCDSWNEIDSIVTDKTVIYTNWSDPTADVVMNTDGTCVGAHKNTYVKGNNGAVEYKCSACGNVEKTFTVGADGINTITLPGASFACNNYNANGMGTNYSVFGNINYDAVNGVQYTRVALEVSGSFEFINGSATPDGSNKTITQTVYGSGKYMVIKMRVGSGESKLKFGIYDTTDKYQKREHDSRFNQNERGTFADGWAVYVIDLSQYDRTFWSNQAYSYGDSSITKAYYGMYGDDDGGENDYVDIAYFAVCDSWAEIKSVVTDEQIILTSWRDNNVEKTDLASYND